MFVFIFPGVLLLAILYVVVMVTNPWLKMYLKCKNVVFEASQREAEEERFAIMILQTSSEMDGWDEREQCYDMAYGPSFLRINNGPWRDFRFGRDNSPYDSQN